MKRLLAIAFTLFAALVAPLAQAQTATNDSTAAHFTRLYSAYAENPADVECLVQLAQFYFDNSNPMRSLPMAMLYAQQAERTYTDIVTQNKYSESAQLVRKGITILTVRTLKNNIAEAASRTVALREEMSDAEMAAYASVFASDPTIQRGLKQLQLKQRYNSAMTDGSIDALYHVVTTYPSTAEAENAEKRIAQLVPTIFAEVESEAAADSIAARYPQSAAVRRAANRLKSRLAYTDACNTGTTESFRRFMQQYPSSDEFEAAAEQYDAKLALEYAALQTADELARFAKNHDDSPLADSATARLVALATDSNSIVATELFLSQFEGDSRYQEILMHHYARHAEEGNLAPLERFAQRYPDFQFGYTTDADLEFARLADSYSLNIAFDEEMYPIFANYVRRLMGKKIAFVPMQRMIQQFVTKRDWHSAGERLWQFDLCFETVSADQYKELYDIIHAPVNRSRVPTTELTASYDVLHPAINETDHKIYYSRIKVGQTYIEAMTRKGNTWTSPTPVEFDNVENAGLTLFSFFNNGRGMLLGHEGDIWVATLENGRWHVSDIPPFPVNTDYIETDATMLPDGSGMLLASDRPGGYNLQPSGTNFHGDTALATDLYFIPYTQHGWGQPVNLGPMVNTPYCERSPLLSKNLKTLYFTTDSRGIGYSDIYETSRTDASDWQHWSEPRNVGREINSGFNEGALSFADDEQRLLFASNQGGSGRYAAYSVPTWHQTSNYSNSVSLEVLGMDNFLLHVKVCDATSQTVTSIIDYWGENRTIDLKTYSDKNYLVMASSDLYFVPAVRVNSREQQQPRLRGYTLPVLVAMTQPLPLEAVTFAGNTSRLEPLAEVQLDDLAQFLISHTDGAVEVAITVAGDDAVQCYNLSHQRALAVRHYLAQQGVEPTRVHIAPLGNTNPWQQRPTTQVMARFRNRQQ